MIIRPLLDVTKRDIEAFLSQRGISWREDSTNKDCVYSRNKIRNIILKEIEENFPDATEKIASAANILRVDDDCLTMLARESDAFKDGVLYADRLKKLHEAVCRRVIIDALNCWGVRDIDFVKIKIVQEAAKGGSGKLYDVGGGVRIIQSYGKISRHEEPRENLLGLKIPVKVGESLEITAFEGIWSIKTVDKMQKMRDNKMRILLDAEKLDENLFVRLRQDGDFISPFGMDGTKKLKKVFIDLKIPKEKRDRISMLTMGDEVLFIPGIRKTKNYLPDENTRKILVAEYKRVD
jgi:tRNA(Ile)-lysidine synthase